MCAVVTSLVSCQSALRSTPVLLRVSRILSLSFPFFLPVLPPVRATRPFHRFVSAQEATDRSRGVSPPSAFTPVFVPLPHLPSIPRFCNSTPLVPLHTTPPVLTVSLRSSVRASFLVPPSLASLRERDCGRRAGEFTRGGMPCSDLQSIRLMNSVMTSRSPPPRLSIQQKIKCAIA